MRVVRGASIAVLLGLIAFGLLASRSAQHGRSDGTRSHDFLPASSANPTTEPISRINPIETIAAMGEDGCVRVVRRSQQDVRLRLNGPAGPEISAETFDQLRRGKLIEEDGPDNYRLTARARVLLSRPRAATMPPVAGRR